MSRNAAQSGVAADELLAVVRTSQLNASIVRRLMKRTSSRPFLSGALALLLAALFTACQSVPTRTAADAADLRRLQGHWEGSGPGGECSVTISGNSLVFYARADFWYETTFTLPAGTNPQQLHATIIKDSSPQQADIGTVVVAVFKIEYGTLTLAVIEDFKRPPPNPVITDSDWTIIESDWTLDRYYLQRIQSQENKPNHPQR